MMKKIYLAALMLTLSSSAWSAQTPITSISEVTATRQALREAVNTKLGTIESNRADHETRVDTLETKTSNIDNTSDANKPISTATQTALDAKANASCFADTASFNDCFTLDWPTGGITYTAGTGITITDGVIASTVVDTDTFASWDKDYADLINKPTIPDITGLEPSLGNPSVNGYVLSSTTTGVRSWVEMTGGGTGIAHATADGNYYASKDGGWASLTGLYAPALGADDNYVTDAEKIKLANLSGTNTGDQDLSGYALKANVLELTNTTAFTPDADYEPATKKYVDDAVTAGGGYTDEAAQDAWGGLLSGGTQTGITVTYDDDNGHANYVVATQFDGTQNTTGTAAGLASQYIDWSASSGGASIANKPTIPTALSDLADDATHRVVTDAEKAAWDAKQSALTADTDYLTPTTAATTYVPKLTQLPTAAPTNGRQIIQAVGGCSNTDYDTQSTCVANGGTWTPPTSAWTSVLNGLINDTGTGSDDLWSAAKNITMLAGKQDSLTADTDYLTPATAASTYQPDLSIPDQAEAEAGTATIERAWTAQRVAQAIAALTPGGVDEIVYQADCSTITNGFCVDTDDGAPYYWNGSAVSAISGGAVDLTAPGPIGSVTPNTGAFTTITAASFDTSAPASGETGEIGLQEDPANGTNTITLKAPADMAADLVFTLPNAYPGGAADFALVGDGTGTLSFVDVVLVSEIGTTVQAYNADLADLADGSLTGGKVGSGISAANITTGILPDARLSTLVPKWVATVPTTASDTCTAGTAAYDSGHIYVCVAANTWVRAALSTW